MDAAKAPEWSIKTKLAAALVATTVLFLLVVIAITVVIQPQKQDERHIAEELGSNIEPLVRTETHISKTQTQLNRYFADGGAIAREDFREEVADTENEFIEDLEAEYGDSDRRRQVEEAQAAWNKGIVIADKIVEEDEPSGRPELAARLDRANRYFERSIEKIEEAKRAGQEEVSKSRFNANKNAGANTAKLAGIIIFGMICAYGATETVKKIVRPIHQLTEDADRIGEGVYTRPVSVDDGEEIREIAEAFNIMTKRFQESTERLEDMSKHDSLTGLNNRRECITRLEGELERALRYGSFVSLIIVDIDGFKEVNEKYGHASGDEIIIDMAKLILDAVRSIDVVARFGGQEYTVILPQATKESAVEVAERIRERVAENEIVLRTTNETLKLYVSLGVAVAPQDARDADGLLKCVDTALRKAKEAGKNRVETFHGPKRRESA